MSRALHAVCLGALLSVARAAVADPREDALAAYRRAEAAEASGRFAEALQAYRDALRIDPSAPIATAARSRVQSLATHAEGDFAPLARLDRVRRDPVMIGDRAEIEALARDATTFPPGRVRSEARLVVAEAWWHKLGEPARAVAPLEAVLEDPAADRLTRAVALNELVGVHRERGDLRRAESALDRWADLAPTLRAEVHRVVRRGALRAAAAGWLAAVAFVGAACFVWLRVRRPEAAGQVLRPLAVAFAFYVGAGGALLVRAYGEGDARPFVWFGLGLLAVDIAARSWRLASASRAAALRALRVAACVVAVLAVAFLAVERTEPAYLEGFGL